ncbi:uncharacterized protein [Montipora capricornis]|uniref:uncharacterized protein n=1 Tax=Montipora capricornis TaxID=246305 RepID=UPI0035F0FCA4
MKSDVVVKFPEKSVLLLAQDDEDQTQIELSLSSVTSESDSLQNLRRRRRDSGVFVSDEAVLTWRRREEQSKSEPIITSASGSFSNQHAHIRRVATKSSLQSTYIPILDKLTEEPLSLPKEIPGVSKEGNGIHVMVDLRSICGPTERRDIGDEIVLGHWQRPEQKRGSEKETDSGSSFQNATQTSSIQKRRATIATETPAKELSPHYATKLEKQAFNKIKEWKEGFAIQLDQVLQQRQNLSQQLQNQGNKYVVDYYSPVYCGDDVKGQTTPSPLSTRKSMSSKQAFAQNLQHRLITELRGLSQMSVIDNKGIPDADKGSKILQEIKKQREKFRDVDENKKLKDELRSLQIQNTQRIAHDMHLDASDTKDNKPSLQQYNYNRKCDEKKGMMENKHGRLNVDDDFCAGSHTSDSQVAQVLSSLRQTIDTIFISTIQRISDLMVKSTSSETHSDNDTLPCDDLLRKIENTKEERDSLYLQNMNLKKEIFDLKRRLADFHEEKVEQISTTFDAVRSSISAASFVHQSGHYVRIDEIDGVVSHLKKFVSEYGGDVTGVQGTISTYIHGMYDSDFTPFFLCLNVLIKLMATVT